MSAASAESAGVVSVTAEPLKRMAGKTVRERNTPWLPSPHQLATKVTGLGVGADAPPWSVNAGVCGDDDEAVNEPPLTENERSFVLSASSPAPSKRACRRAPLVA